VSARGHRLTEPLTRLLEAPLRRRLGGYADGDVRAALAELARRIGEAEHAAGEARARVALLREAGERRASLERELHDTLLEAEREARRARDESERARADLLDAARSRNAARTAELQRERAGLAAEGRALDAFERQLRLDLTRLLADAASRLPHPSQDTGVPPRAGDAAPAPGQVAAEAAAGGEETGPPLPPPPGAVPAQRRHEPPSRSRAAALLTLVLGLAGVGVAAGLLAAGVGSSDGSAPRHAEPAAAASTARAAASQPEPGSPATAPAPSTAAATTVPAPAVAATTSTEPGGVQAAAPPGTTRIRLAVRAARGDCWLSVRRGSAAGAVLFEGFLFEGEGRTFVGRRLWVRMGAPSNLVVRVNGAPAAGLPDGTADVLFTSRGLEVQALG
jgi:hypothetical protein